MSMRDLGFWMSGMVLVFFTGSALAEEMSAPPPAPKPAAKSPKRRVERHDRARSAQVKGKSHWVVIPVTVVGRPGRPLSVFESSAQRFDFPVGTARYSPTDQRFLRSKPGERW